MGKTAKHRRIRVHVVHESRMVAEALSVTLKSLLPGSQVSGWTKSWETYLNRAEGVADVVVLDNELSNGGPTAAKINSLVGTGGGIVVLGSATYPPAISRVIDSGAHAYVLQTEPAAVLAEAIAAAFRNESYRSPEVAGIVSAHVDEPIAGLTPRELEIVAAYVSGSGGTVPETAARFSLSVETVRTHISHARRKYATDQADMVSKMELRRRMVRDGWILS